MDKLKKYAGDAGLGLGGGILAGYIVFLNVIEYGYADPFNSLLITLYFIGMGFWTYLFLPILGGILVGSITNKWWGPLVGGFIIFTLELLVMGIIGNYLLAAPS